MAVDTRFYRPADYYSSASPERVLPAWASYGCGAASLLVLLLVFAGGAYLAGGGFTDLMDLALGMTLSEMRGMYTSDVTAAQKKELEREVEAMREKLRTQKLSVQRIQPVLEAIRKATGDEKLNANEVESITALTRKTNAGKK